MPSRSTWSLVPALCCLVPAVLCAASAQAAGKPKRTRVAVLDFENPTGRSGPALGQWAADALAPLLGGEGSEVVPRDQVRRALGDTPCREPLHVLVSALAPLKVQEIITGRVLKADVRKGMPRQAHIRLDVLVFDVELGVCIRRAIANGVSAPRYDQVTEREMLEDAAAKAAVAAVRDLASCAVPRGTVLAAKPDQCVVSIGSEAGLKAEQELLVRRGSETVGRLQVVTLTARDAVCRALGGAGRIAAQDEVVGIYESPIPLQPPMSHWSVMQGMFVPAVSQVLPYVAMMLRGRDLPTPEMPAPSVASIVSPNGSPAVRVRWSVPIGSRLDLLGYQVYRSTTQHGNYEPVLQVVGPNEHEAVDTAGGCELECVMGGAYVPGGQVAGSGIETKKTQVRGVQPGATYYYRVAGVRFVPPKDGAEGKTDAANATYRMVVTDLGPTSAGVTLPVSGVGVPAESGAAPERATVAVLDFANLAGEPGAALAPLAAQTLSELLGSEKVQVIPCEKTRRFLTGSPPGIDLVALRDIAPALAAEYGVREIITGTLFRAGVRQAKTNTGSVLLDVRVMDVRFGEFTRGAIATGAFATERGRMEPAAMLQRAASQAGDEAASILRSYAVPRGTVVQAGNGEYVLSTGSDGGLDHRKEVLALREGKVVGRLKVVRATEGEALCRTTGAAAPIPVGAQVVGLYAPHAWHRPPDRSRRHLGWDAVRSLLSERARLRQPRWSSYRVAGIRTAVMAGEQPGVRVTWSLPQPVPPDVLGFRIHRSRMQYGSYELVGEVEGASATEFLDAASDRILLPRLAGTPGASLSGEPLFVRGVRPGEVCLYAVTCAYATAKPEQATGSAPPHGESDFTPPTAGTVFPAETGAAAPPEICAWVRLAACGRLCYN